jgi:hypothetical protein
MMVLS